MPNPDAVVIGAGHNGLICAQYLARAGLRVHVVERRSIAGGCTATEQMAPGVFVSRCFCDHVFLYATPIPEELELERYGLENLAIDPPYFAPRLNDAGLVFWTSLERTVDVIARRSPRDARAYAAFARRWGELFDWLQPVLLGSPDARSVRTRMLTRPGRLLRGARHLPRLRSLARASMRDVLNATFSDMHLKGVLAFLSAGLAGVSPAAPGSAVFAFAAVLPHRVGVRRPRGGSGGLVGALVRGLEAHDGIVHTGRAAERIIVRGGTAEGVRLDDGTEIPARLVVAACDPQTTFLRLLEHQEVPAPIRGAIERLSIANGFALKVDYVVDRLPAWTAPDWLGLREQACATKIICPSIEYLEAAYGDYEKKRNPRWPALMVGTPTALDPGLAPEGRHLLTLETRYTPYRLDGGLSWHAIRQREGERLLEFLQQYAPNLAGAERLRIVQTPEDLERDLGLPQAQMLHVDPLPQHMFARRPIPECADYRTPVCGLYLTGAGTHPGGGVWGAPGRNAAHAILEDLRLRDHA